MDEQRKSESELVPALRFEGFTDPWEQRKLGEIAHRVTRKNEEGASDLPLTISAQHGLVDQRDFFGSQVASRDMRGYYLLEKGEFAYNKSTSGDSPWGAVKRLARYEKGCLSTLYICFGLDVGDPSFLVTYYETNRWHKGIRLIAAEGARNHGLLNIAPRDFFETELTLPGEIEEQSRIGALFARLDSLIALHQRKYEKLKTVKQSLLEKMFPKEGEDVPELRFEGFTDPWEQRKLGEYLCVSAETNKAYEFSREDVLSVSGEYGVVNQVEFQGRSFAGANVSGYGILRTGDLVYTKSPLKTNPYGIIKANLGRSGIVSTLYATYKTKNEANPRFIDVYFSLNPRVNRYLYPLVNKGAKNDMNVSAENAIRGYVVFPSLTAQAEIGALFAKIDSLIALHQRELEILKNLKKALLEKMFV